MERRTRGVGKEGLQLTMARRYRLFPLFILGCSLVLSLCATAYGDESRTAEPGKARAELDGKALILSNSSIAGRWEVANGKFRALSITDALHHRTVPLAENTFALTLKDGTLIAASRMTVVVSPKIEALHADANARQLAARFDGQKIELVLEDKAHSLEVTWRAILRDEATYVQQELTFRAKNQNVEIDTIRLIDLSVSDAHVSGIVKGSPVVAGNMFFGFEHPLSQSKVSGDRVICQISRELPLKAGQSVDYSSVIGVTPDGQMRRGFLSYVERERAHPYRTFLHYNSWYDLGYFTKFDEAGAVNVIEAFGRELGEKRGVKLDSFLFDDGWDDPATLWKFHSGFPRGFAPLKEAAARYSSSPGVWLSPWGGYGKPRAERLKFGKERGFETNEGGFALSGPKYYARFRETSLDFIRNYGINQFKIDGTGNTDSAIPGSEFDSDFHAAINLIQEWRTVKPDLYVNLTTGTYPSPFWLRYADSIWRGGEDDSFAGVGSYRQRWITYRDADVYEGVVLSGALYPLNSLMLHGLIYARHARHLDTDPTGDFTDEVRSYFGTGTQLQEMYITPSLLSQKDWDVLAEAAKWSRQNADVLVDTHWIGGDPAMLEVYGWAAWSPQKGILTLRNPSDKAQDFTAEIQKLFELPANAPKVYKTHSPWQEDMNQPAVELRAGQPHTFHLEPFQVLMLDAVPSNP